MIELMEHQLDAIDELGNGKILFGEVGVGKSITTLGYYVKKETPRDIYVITTAKKRDSGDWEREASGFGIGPSRDLSLHGTITVDSWNNIHRYVGVSDAFFIFDEQRVIGTGSWVRDFIKIARRNHWVLLSATPGDTWLDYAPVFIANGWYKNITEFRQAHVRYKPYLRFPVVDGYLNEQKLELLRNAILVEMRYLRPSKQALNYYEVGYDAEELRRLYRDRWNPHEERPIKDASEMWRLMRRSVNSHPSRLEAIHHLMTIHPRLIIFYNFNYELDILRTLGDFIAVGEWNGHKHEQIPDADRWVYLVQYVSGAEGWNCITTDAMILYSLTYSYKNFVQSRGRIDRLDSPFCTFYYYVFVSHSVVDSQIGKSLSQKKTFNERKFLESEAFKSLRF